MMLAMRLAVFNAKLSQSIFLMQITSPHGEADNRPPFKLTFYCGQYSKIILSCKENENQGNKYNAELPVSRAGCRYYFYGKFFADAENIFGNLCKSHGRNNFGNVEKRIRHCYKGNFTDNIFCNWRVQILWRR